MALWYASREESNLTLEELYTSFDLHSNNSYLGIKDENGKPVFSRKLPNDPEIIRNTLKPYKNDIVGIVVESTYNWYWLVDLLMAEGYVVHLWLAEMLRLGILPEGYIYPKEDRPIRDLLRKRMHLVRLRTSLGERVTRKNASATLIQMGDCTVKN